MKNQTWIPLTLSATLLTALLGCGTLVTQDLNQVDSLGVAERSGIAYFLPLGKIHLVATKTLSLTTNVPAGVNSHLRIQEKTSTLTVTNSVDKGSEVTINVEKLQGTNLVHELSRIFTNISYTVSIEEVLERDPSNVFLLRPRTSLMAEDTFNFSVTNGLLHTVNSTNIDKSGDILLKLGQTGIEAFKLASGLPSIPAGKENVAPEELPDKIDIVFNPFTELNKANVSLAKAGLVLSLDGISVNKALTSLPESKNGRGEYGGVFYKPLLPYTLRVENGREFRTKTILMPNESPILVYQAKRSAFGTRSSQAIFQAGVLSEIRLSKQSEIAGFVDIPLSLLRSIAAVPSELIQLKLNYANTNAAMIAAQKAIIESMYQRIESERKYHAALTNVVSNSATNASN